MENLTFSAYQPIRQYHLIIIIIVLVLLVLVLGLIFFVLRRRFRRLKSEHDDIHKLFALYKTFIDAEDNLVYLKDSDLKYVFVNKAFTYFFELNEDEVAGLDDYDFMDAEIAEKNRETDRKVFEHRAVIVDDFKMNNRNYRVTKFPVTLLNGSIGVGAHIKDVTDEQRNIKQREIYLKTLLSIGDGVMVVDRNGMVEMINKEAERLTGWSNSEAVGKPYREVFPLECDGNDALNDFVKCVLEKGCVNEFKINARFTARNDKEYYIEYCAAPIKDDMDNAIGVVVVFRDVTERKLQNDKIEYLSYHDSLTGLYNRRFFEEKLRRLDTESNLPMSIIMGDMNGLKLTNDIFGHVFGDALLVKMAEVLKRVCREQDVIARWGGDEFVILLPKTSCDQATDIIKIIKHEFAEENIKAIKGSISMGCATKQKPSDNIKQVLEYAEDMMYSVKTLERDDIRNSAIDYIITSLHENSAREREHSIRVSELCCKMGKALEMSEVEVRKLKEAGYLHDIGKIVLEPGLMNKNHLLTNREWNEVKRHSVIGYRILNSFDNTLDLAESVLAHHERWNGSGYPKGLKGDEIPLIARIIAIVEGYDRMTHDSDNIKAMSKEEAIGVLKENAGVLFDPGLVDVFIKTIQNEED